MKKGKQSKTETRAFFVTWDIDIWATSPQDAARQALAIQRDPESIAQVFKVFEGNQQHDIDLQAEDWTSEIVLVAPQGGVNE